jgi:hypothetical protein
MRARALIVLGTATLLAGPPHALAANPTGGTSPDAPTPPSSQPSPTPPSSGGPTVRGTKAKLIRGIAYAPAAAPERVKRAIWATNQIVGRPYKYAGGHRRWNDTGYDCSGLTSYFLHAAGLLRAPESAPFFMSFGQPGRGRWVTVWARRGHVYLIVAGLRLDTTPYPDRGREGSDWRVSGRDTSRFVARHPAGL